MVFIQLSILLLTAISRLFLFFLFAWNFVLDTNHKAPGILSPILNHTTDYYWEANPNWCSLTEVYRIIVVIQCVRVIPVQLSERHNSHSWVLKNEDRKLPFCWWRWRLQFETGLVKIEDLKITIKNVNNLKTIGPTLYSESYYFKLILGSYWKKWFSFTKTGNFEDKRCLAKG